MEQQEKQKKYSILYKGDFELNSICFLKLICSIKLSCRYTNIPPNLKQGYRYLVCFKTVKGDIFIWCTLHNVKYSANGSLGMVFHTGKSNRNISRLFGAVGHGVGLLVMVKRETGNVAYIGEKNTKYNPSHAGGAS